MVFFLKRCCRCIVCPTFRDLLRIGFIFRRRTYAVIASVFLHIVIIRAYNLLKADALLKCFFSLCVRSGRRRGNTNRRVRRLGSDMVWIHILQRE